MRLNRRSLLKLSSLLLTQALIPPLPGLDHYTDGLPESPAVTRPLIGFARAINWGVVIRAEPSLDAKVVGSMVNHFL